MLATTRLLSLRHLRFSQIPLSPGVYIFWGDAKPIYIGKAVNLKARLKSYFSLQLAGKTRSMIKEADHLSFVKVTSELESLLLEARLIREYQPRYNSAAKDDKQPLYIRISKEFYPRVLTARKIDASGKNLAFFGPFPSSTSVRSVLKLLRKIFPYAEHPLGKRPCLYSQIGLCSPCPNSIEKSLTLKEKKDLRASYLKNIRRLKGVLQGRIKSIKKELFKEMKKHSDKLDYEEAQKAKEKLDRLEYITQPIIPSEAYLENPNLVESLRSEELKDLKKILKGHLSLKSLKRIECFDVAHLSGESTAASMVTFVRGEAERSLYRHFRIKGAKKRDDIASLKEVVKRRVRHLSSWGRPDLVIVDGGKGQVAVFFQTLDALDIAIVGLAKREETLVIPRRKEKSLGFTEIRLKRGPALNLVTRIRDEAHRFARRYHHRLVKKSLLNYT